MKKKCLMGPIMIDIAGTALSQYDKEKIAHPNTGAVILFARNYESPAQLAELSAAIKQARGGDILIAVDQEGGRVQRCQQGFTRLPPAAAYAHHADLTQQAGWLMAAELLVQGVDFSFAPVLDVDAGVSEIIGNRSFSGDETEVTQLAADFRKGMRQAGMSAVGKHFPGHGAVALDSHLALPVDERAYDEIWQKDIMPFKRLIADGLEGIMPAHIVYSEVDELPAGFSYHWVTEILRQRLGFEGAVFTDDLSMQGAASIGDFVERARLAQQAGCDMMLVCNNETAAEQVLENLKIKVDGLREQRLQAMLSQSELSEKILKNSDAWQVAHKNISKLAEHYVD